MPEDVASTLILRLFAEELTSPLYASPSKDPTRQLEPSFRLKSASEVELYISSAFACEKPNAEKNSSRETEKHWRGNCQSGIFCGRKLRIYFSYNASMLIKLFYI